MTKIMRYLFGEEAAKAISTRTFDGEHWYAAVDLCCFLGIENHSQAVHRKRERDDLTLKSSEWRKFTLYNGRRKKNMLLVNNGGMLKLIFQGGSDFAKMLQKRANEIPASLIPPQWAEYMTYD